jgi:hypothetical protein
LPYHSAALGVSLPMGIGMFALALVDGVLMPNSSGAAETTDPLLNHEVLRQLGFGVFTDTVIAHGQGSPGRTAAAGASVLLGQMFQNEIAGLLGLGKRFEWRAAYLDRATTLMKWTP